MNKAILAEVLTHCDSLASWLKSREIGRPLGSLLWLDKKVNQLFSWSENNVRFVFGSKMPRSYSVGSGTVKTHPWDSGRVCPSQWPLEPAVLPYFSKNCIASASSLPLHRMRLVWSLLPFHSSPLSMSCVHCRIPEKCAAFRGDGRDEFPHGRRLVVLYQYCRWHNVASSYVTGTTTVWRTHSLTHHIWYTVLYDRMNQCTSNVKTLSSDNLLCYLSDSTMSTKRKKVMNRTVVTTLVVVLKVIIFKKYVHSLFV